jgi:hypothetical protein
MRSDAKSESLINRCQGHHTDPTFPTTLKEELHNLEELDGDNDDDDEVDETMNLGDQVDVMELFQQQATI